MRISASFGGLQPVVAKSSTKAQMPKCVNGVNGFFIMRR